MEAEPELEYKAGRVDLYNRLHLCVGIVAALVILLPVWVGAFKYAPLLRLWWPILAGLELVFGYELAVALAGRRVRRWGTVLRPGSAGLARLRYVAALARISAGIFRWVLLPLAVWPLPVALLAQVGVRVGTSTYISAVTAFVYLYAQNKGKAAAARQTGYVAGRNVAARTG